MAVVPYVERLLQDTDFGFGTLECTNMEFKVVGIQP